MEGISVKKRNLLRITKPTLSIAEHLLNLKGKSTFGLEISRHTGLGSASVYSVLDRFEEYGWITSEWENDSQRKGARRRLYGLTKEGKARLRELIESQNAVPKPATRKSNVGLSVKRT